MHLRCYNRPPTLPIYDGLIGPKQFLMSYKATISPYGGNSAVMPKSFVMAVRSVNQTWYSSLRLWTISSWLKLKELLLTSSKVFSRSLSPRKLCSSVNRSQMNISNHLSKGSSGFGLMLQLFKMTSSSKQ